MLAKLHYASDQDLEKQSHVHPHPSRRDHQGRDRGARLERHPPRHQPDLGVPVSRLTAIINGKRSISVDTAMRLGLCFGNGARFWLARQVHYDLAIAEIERGAEIARTVRVAA